MPRGKVVRDTKEFPKNAKKVEKNGTKPADKSEEKPKMIELNLANAPIFSAKFTEGIRDELKSLRIEFVKYNSMLGDIVKMMREQNG